MAPQPPWLARPSAWTLLVGLGLIGLASWPLIFIQNPPFLVCAGGAACTPMFEDGQQWKASLTVGASAVLLFVGMKGAVSWLERGRQANE